MDRDPRKTVVLDTNIFICAQDYAQQGHKDGEIAAEVLKAVGELGYTPVIAAATLDDLARSGEIREFRVPEAERYARVEPTPPGDLRQRAGYGDSLDENDDCDLRILAALDQGLAAWLITNDGRMIGHAERAGLAHVLDARQFLEFLEPARHPLGPPPRVDTVPPGQVNIASPFFSSLVGSYPEFHDQGAIDKGDFFAYYAGRERATGIRVGTATRLRRALSLAGGLGVVRPPQSFRYLTEGGFVKVLAAA